VGHVVPGVDENRLAFAVAGDLMLLSSFFVLGGEFWDRLRGIFIRAPADGLS
jgi:hypothetical protein